MKYVTIIVLFMLCFFMVLACQKDSTTGPESGDGSLVIKITDAPFPISLIEETNVTINKIEIRKEEENEGYPFLTVFDEKKTVNLIHLRNEITEDLPEIPIPAGTYNLVRLYVADASIVLKDGRQFDLKVPSGAETGIKMFVDPPLNVVGGITTELLLDFDLEQSFVVQGNPNTPAGINGFIFKPVIRAINNTVAGRIAGAVTSSDSIAVQEAHVWVEQDSVISSTFSDSTGQFALIGLPAGLYSAYATKAGFDTVSVSAVHVVKGNKSSVDFVLTPQ